MRMNEVNDKFPVMKYRIWAAERAREGLPSVGGVSGPNSPAKSICRAYYIEVGISAKNGRSTEERQLPNTASPSPATTAAKERTQNDTKTEHGITQPSNAGQVFETDGATAQSLRRMPSDDNFDEARGIEAATTTGCLTFPGDTCAICIDMLEDDDIVRGLACGHAFHARCIDPWLTNRCPCCPLCKANCHMQVPQPAPGDEVNTIFDPRNNARANLPIVPRHVWFRGCNSNSSRHGIPVDTT